MTFDWPGALVAQVRLKQRIAAVDKEKLYPYTLPAVAAKPEEIDRTEAALGLALDRQHREFLSYANGWRAFYATSDLLSTEQLAGGQHVAMFNAWLAQAPPQAAENGYRAGSILPISVDLEYPTFFVMRIEGDQVGREVVWLAPTGVVDEFSSFQEFFASMYLYSERTLQDFESGK